ncbi:hypothetical protein CYMTET_33522 [Cymbomonas tetramitiformis]|uniref:U-box domain-containing protein n=1 Tax=Cymbomonas tetramitiformis TaxID=36881 RepID=A0AAE0KR43_9CHLO|nr:hypothetical protein CYMTET_33522 [Cymbomonas tetramitiformis]
MVASVRPSLSDHVQRLLHSNNLSHFSEALQSLGVIDEPDLLLVEEEEQRRVGMTKIERKRFEKVLCAIRLSSLKQNASLSTAPTCLPDKSVNGQLAAALAIGNIVHISGEYRNAAVDAGAVPHLVKLLRTGCEEEKQAAAFAIRNIVLDGDPHRISVILESGAAHELVVLLKSTKRTRNAAAAALHSLSCRGLEQVKAVVGAGALPHLIHLLAEDAPADGTDVDMTSGRNQPQTSHESDTRNGNGIVDDGENGWRGQLNIEVGPGAVPLLVQLLSGGDARAKEAAAVALRNLLSDSEEHVEAVLEAGAVSLLVQLLRTGTDSAKSRCAECLCNLADYNNRYRDAIVEAGAVPLLVLMLSSGSDMVKMSAAACLCNLSWDSRERADALVQAGGMPPLVLLLTSGSEESIMASAGTLCNLAYDSDDLRDQVIVAGALPLLVILLNSDGAEAVKEEAARCLRNLAHGSERRRDAVMAAEAVPALVKVLHSGARALAKEESVKALWTLAYGSAARRGAIVDAAVLPQLVRLLSSDGPGASVAAAGALRALLHNESEVDAVIQESCLTRLHGLLGTKNDAMKEAAGRLLERVLCLCVSRHAPRFTEVNFAQRLVSLLGSTCEGVRQAGSGALAQLLSYSRTQPDPAAVVNLTCDAVPMLVRVLRSKHSAAKEAAVGALHHLACGDDTRRDSIVAAGAVPLLVKMLTACSDLAKEEAIKVLMALTWESDIRQKAIIDAGAVPPLMKVLHMGTNGLKHAAAGALGMLSSEGPGQALESSTTAEVCRLGPSLVTAFPPSDVGQNGQSGSGVGCPVAEVKPSITQPISALVQQMHSADDATRMLGLRELLKLMSESDLGKVNGASTDGGNTAAEVLSVLLENREVIVHMLHSICDVAKETAAQAIRILAHNRNDHRDLIVHSGAVPALVTLLEFGSDLAKEAATSALWTLAYDSGERTNTIVNAGALPLVIKLLQTGGDQAKEAAAGSLCNLACDSNVHRDAIVENGAVPLLVEVLSTGTDKAKEEAVKTLSNLARDSNERRNAILAAGSAPVLVQLLQTGSEGAQAASAGALGILACGCDQRRNAIIGAGAIASLEQLCRIGGTSQGPEMAACALRQLK